VLIGPITASSGEMTAIAFIGRKNVRLFGNATAGFTSANRTYQLNDGALLALTEMGVGDRLSREYSGPIVADEHVRDKNAKSAALKWLKRHADSLKCL
jgi:carboxyl-terminal processing protease